MYKLFAYSMLLHEEKSKTVKIFLKYWIFILPMPSEHLKYTNDSHRVIIQIIKNICSQIFRKHLVHNASHVGLYILQEVFTKKKGSRLHVVLDMM